MFAELLVFRVKNKKIDLILNNLVVAKESGILRTTKYTV